MESKEKIMDEVRTRTMRFNTVDQRREIVEEAKLEVMIDTRDQLLRIAEGLNTVASLLKR